MRKIFAFILLLSHVNFSMLIPQLDELDVYDANGNQLPDIDTLGEYVSQVVLNHKPPANSKDEDDDNARYFHIVRLDDYNLSQTYCNLIKPCWSTINDQKYPPYNQKGLPAIAFEIQIPPPKC